MMINRIKSIVDSNRIDIKAAHKSMLADLEKAKKTYKPEAYRSKAASIKAKFEEEVTNIRNASLRSIEFLQKRLDEDDYSGIRFAAKSTIPVELLADMNLIADTLDHVPEEYLVDFARKAFESNSIAAMAKVSEMAKKEGIRVTFPDAKIAQDALSGLFQEAKRHINQYDPESLSMSDRLRFHDVTVDQLLGRFEERFQKNQLVDLSIDALKLEEADKLYRIAFEKIDNTFREKPEEKPYELDGRPDPLHNAISMTYCQASDHYCDSCWLDDDDALDIHDALVNF